MRLAYYYDALLTLKYSVQSEQNSSMVFMTLCVSFCNRIGSMNDKVRHQVAQQVIDRGQDRLFDLRTSKILMQSPFVAASAPNREGCHQKHLRKRNGELCVAKYLKCIRSGLVICCFLKLPSLPWWIQFSSSVHTQADETEDAWRHNNSNRNHCSRPRNSRPSIPSSCAVLTLSDYLCALKQCR
jgi:hypothetical protein